VKSLMLDASNRLRGALQHSGLPAKDTPMSPAASIRTITTSTHHVMHTRLELSSLPPSQDHCLPNHTRSWNSSGRLAGTRKPTHRIHVLFLFLLSSPITHTTADIRAMGGFIFLHLLAYIPENKVKAFERGKPRQPEPSTTRRTCACLVMLVLSEAFPIAEKPRPQALLTATESGGSMSAGSQASMWASKDEFVATTWRTGNCPTTCPGASAAHVSACLDQLPPPDIARAAARRSGLYTILLYSR